MSPDDKIAAIRAGLEGVTPGPWAYRPPPLGRGEVESSILSGIAIIDADTGDEIGDIIPPRECVIPHSGETIHYWIDGTPDAATGGGHSRQDFEIVRVVHDWRHMPQGRAETRMSIVLYVRRVGG
jgi:hypothetical protein